MSTCENKTMTAEQLEALQIKAQKAMSLLRKSFTSALEYIDTIEVDLKNNSGIPIEERAMYLDADDELGYLVHDWSSLENPDSSWSQNTEIVSWLQAINEYKNALATYRQQYNQTH